MIPEDQLTLARRHVKKGEERVRRQEATLAELVRDGHPTHEAEQLLDTMRKTLALMREEVAELEVRPPQPSRR